MALRAGRDDFTSLQSGFVKNTSTIAGAARTEGPKLKRPDSAGSKRCDFLPKGLLSTKLDRQVIRSPVALSCLEKGKDSSSPSILLQ